MGEAAETEPVPPSRVVVSPPAEKEVCQVHIQEMTVQDFTILHSFNVEFPPNTVTGILGPNGSDARGTVQNLPVDMALVPQDDRLHGFYTCRSYLRHYARLMGIPTQDAETWIENLLIKLGLKDAADTETIVGDLFLTGLSGGQKRRLSIALEALSHPVHFFLMNRPVDWMPRARKGKLMYQGPRPAMEEFFSKVGFATPPDWNPADHYLALINDEFREHQLSPNEWAEKFVEWKADQKPKLTNTLEVDGATKLEFIPINRQSNPLRTSSELTYRYWINIFFNSGILATRAAMYVMVALMCGALFWNLGERYDFESVQSRIALSYYIPAFTSDPNFSSGEKVLKLYELDDVNRRNDMLVLIGYALIVHSLSFLVWYFIFASFLYAPSSNPQTSRNELTMSTLRVSVFSVSLVSISI